MSKLKTYVARLSAVALLIMLLWGCGRVPKLSEQAPPSSRLPFVRVLLDNGSRQHTIATADGHQMAIGVFRIIRASRLSWPAKRINWPCMPMTAATSTITLTA